MAFIFTFHFMRRTENDHFMPHVAVTGVKLSLHSLKGKRLLIPRMRNHGAQGAQNHHLKKKERKKGAMICTFNPSTGQTEAGGSPTSSRPVWDIH